MEVDIKMLHIKSLYSPSKLFLKKNVSGIYSTVYLSTIVTPHFAFEIFSLATFTCLLTKDFNDNVT